MRGTLGWIAEAMRFLIGLAATGMALLIAFPSPYLLDASPWAAEPTSTTSTPAPSARASIAMAYDSESDRVILFGGNTNPGNPGVLSAETWAYDLDTETWRTMNPPVAPPGLGASGMAYDVQSDRVILFGGYTSGFADQPDQVVTNETWAYDFNSDSWTERTPVLSPSARSAPSMTYNVRSDRIVLVGGYDGSSSLRDTWTYDYDSDTWQAMAPTTTPTTGDSAAIAYDAESDRAIVFGGAFGGPAVPPPHGDNNKTWAYDLTNNTWTEQFPPQNPPKRWVAAATYDSFSDRVVLFGGIQGLVPNPPPLGDSWAYDQNTNTWTEMNPSVRPAARCCHAMAYDSKADRIVLFGGRTTRFENDTWAYDIEQDLWIPLTRPSAPAGLRVAAGDSRVDLSWIAPSSTGGVPIMNYRIYRGTMSGTPTLQIDVGNVLSYADNTVANGVTYYFQVSAVTAAGEGERSNEAFTTPLPTPDTVPPSIAIVSPAEGATLASTVVAISGTASDDVGLERVELSTDGVSWTRATGTTSWSGTLILAGGPNTIHARATDTSGNVGYANVQVTVVLPSGDGGGMAPLTIGVIVGVAAVGAATGLIILMRRRRK